METTHVVGRKKSPLEMVDYRKRQYDRVLANLLSIEAHIAKLDRFELRASDLPEAHEKAFNRAESAYATLKKAAVLANIDAPQSTHIKTH